MNNNDTVIDGKRRNGNEKDKRCGEQDEAPLTAFRRSSLLMRSPPARQKPSPTGGVSRTGHSACGNAATLTDTPTDAGRSVSSPRGGGAVAVDDSNECAVADARAPITGDTAAASGEREAVGLVEGSPRLELIRRMRKMEEEAISQCRATLSGMQGALNRQRNISSDVKIGISKVAELLDVMASYRRTWKAAEEERSMSDLRRDSAGRRLVHAPTPTTAKPKRAATSPAASGISKRPRAKEPGESVGVTPPPVIVGEAAPRGKDGGKSGDGDWQKVSRKTRRRGRKKGSAELGSPARSSAGSNGLKRRRPGRLKPEAVMVKPAQGHSYSEVLKGLRSGMAADDSDRIRSVRRTMTGAILLELGKGQRVDSGLVQKLKNSVRETAYITELKQRTTVEIRELDSLTVKEEVETAIRAQLDSPEEQLQTKVTEPNVRDQVRAFVTMAAESAEKLMSIGHIKVGWIRARIRACEDIKRCYRCLGMGHLQSGCSGPDRRDVCIRCGGGGHRMKDCRAAPRCVHCVEAKRSVTDHLPGSGRCPLAGRR